MQALSRREETAVMDIARAEAETACKDTLRDFALCATGRTITMGWVCKPQLEAMRACMRAAVDEARIDELKAEFLANRDQQSEAAKERYIQERIEAMKRYAGIKDEPSSVPKATSINPPRSVQQGSVPTPILPTSPSSQSSPAPQSLVPGEPVWSEDRPFGR